jgi:predicted RNA-binding protein with PUA-like domain
VTQRVCSANIPGVKHWLVKQEPEDYGWDEFVRDGRTAWTGVRNFQARNNLRAMQAGDLVLFYHSGAEKRVVGVARVARDAYPDPTADDGDWVCVDLAPVQALKESVALAAIKADPVLSEMKVLKQTRLSVVALAGREFTRILGLGRTTLR